MLHLYLLNQQSDEQTEFNCFLFTKSLWQVSSGQVALSSGGQRCEHVHLLFSDAHALRSVGEVLQTQ